MSRANVALLTREMDQAWAAFSGTIEALTEEEYHGRPAPGALTLDDLLPPDCEAWRRRYDASEPSADNNALAYTTAVERDFFAKFPAPPPLSTIEHKVAHVAACKLMYADYAFGTARLRWHWADLRVPRTLSGMRTYLHNAHRELRSHLDRLADVDLKGPRLTNWGARWPTECIVWTMIHHDVYHDAQVRTMRACYRVHGEAPEGRLP